jgi:alpha-D-ribose 1-methylphosphonate 5-triphosphate synthase subunit PhnI
MAYVAFRGGAAAIAAAAESLEILRCAGGGEPITVAGIEQQLHALTGRVCAEGGVWQPRLAALALKQSAGDAFEAAFLLRAWRSQRPRLGETPVHDGSSMRVVRRITAAFKDVPGGQVLGPCTDYLQRLFRYELLDEDPERFRRTVADWLGNHPQRDAVLDMPDIVAGLRAEGLVPPEPAPGELVDITREPLRFPAPRSAALAIMARGEAGGLLAIAYSTMRGYGYLHPTVAELRFGWLPVRLPHEFAGMQEIGEVPVTECTILAMHGHQEGALPTLSLGYGACFGHQEVKAIAMAMCDRSMSNAAGRAPEHPAEDQEYVLHHIDGIESMGFCSHYKLPHHVTFQADLAALRAARRAESVPAEATP